MARTSNVSQANAELACSPRRSGENLWAPELSPDRPAPTLPTHLGTACAGWGWRLAVTRLDLGPVLAQSHPRKGRPVLSDSLTSPLRGKPRAGEGPGPAWRGPQAFPEAGTPALSPEDNGGLGAKDLGLCHNPRLSTINLPK